MPLSPGTRLGPYEILAPLGAGGMGEVYKARDTRLNRTVAIKVLREASAALPDVRQRFEREARAVSSLNHPHICSLFDIGQQDGVSYLVMEFLEGKTLAERIKKGPLPLDQTLRFATDIASALDAAHSHGVVHRDLKPSNIMLTDAGAKVLDFGLAKIQERTAVVSGASMDHTRTSPLTGEGAIVGTLQYMAPEQLEGKEADARTDLFAFGAVLYEMVTGHHAFEATSQAALISNIMVGEPAPLSAVQPLASPNLDLVVRTCLAKNPGDRWQSAHDLLLQLNWMASAGSQAGMAAPVPPERKSRQSMLWATIAALALAVLTVSFMHFSEKPADLHPIRFQIYSPPKSVYPPFDLPALSPDGRHLVFLAQTGGAKPVLWLRSMDSTALQPLAGTEDAAYPFWSPDGRYVAFFAFADGKLKKIDLAGAPPQTICDARNGAGGAWGSDGTILFASLSYPLRRVPAGGGAPQNVLPIDTSRRELAQYWPQFLPGGRRFLYFSRNEAPEKSGIRVGSLDSGETRPVLAAGSRASFVPPGYLLFAQQDVLMAQAFDARNLQLSRDPFPIAAPVGRGSGGPANPSLALFSLSDNGVLLWRSGANLSARVISFARDGKPLGPLGETHAIRQITLSPDEKRLAAESRDSNGTPNIWTIDVTSGIFSRVTSDPAGDPVWSPDSRELAFASSRQGGFNSLYRKRVGGPPEEFVFKSGESQFPTQWFRDGSLMFLTLQGKAFYRLPLAGERKPELLFQSEFDKDQPTVSPDGRWIAYNAMDSGRWEVYVASYPGFTERRQVSAGGGCQPLWSNHGKELSYLTLSGKMMAVDVKAGAAIETSLPRELFAVPLRVDPILNQYAVTADGRKFFVLENLDEGPIPMNVTLNWNAGLAR